LLIRHNKIWGGKIWEGEAVKGRGKRVCFPGAKKIFQKVNPFSKRKRGRNTEDGALGTSAAKWAERRKQQTRVSVERAGGKKEGGPGEIGKKF